LYKFKKILVTGGAGYVGSKLVPVLLKKGYEVVVLDLCIYGENLLPKHSNLTLVKADLRDLSFVAKALQGCDAVIHLACISNDPSFELNPKLGKSINLDSFEPLVQLAIKAGVKRFIYASSSSVYGIKEEEKVTENLSLEPLTDYSKYKAECEKILKKYSSKEFVTLTVRPATVCGYSPRLRLDLIVNILTTHAVINKKIKIFGGQQYRPNIHIDDMVEFYVKSLLWKDEEINGEEFNVGYTNYTVNELSNIVAKTVGGGIEKSLVVTDDERSYRVCCEKAYRVLGFKCEKNIEQAVETLIQAFKQEKVKEALSNPLYYNIKKMRESSLN
jgi:nucleoside-diphosphate-sugar epimerase